MPFSSTVESRSKIWLLVVFARDEWELGAVVQHAQTQYSDPGARLREKAVCCSPAAVVTLCVCEPSLLFCLFHHPQPHHCPITVIVCLSFPLIPVHLSPLAVV